MGCEQCKLLDASESESHDNVIANVTAAENSADPCETAIKEDATNATNLTSSVNQNFNLATTENGVPAMEQGAPEQGQLPEESTAAPIRSLIELCDIDSNILDSTERLEVHDEVADLSQSPNSAVLEEAVGSSDLVTDDSLSEQVLSEPDNSRQSNTEDEANEDSSEETVVRKRRGTVRVNSIRGHKVCQIFIFLRRMYFTLDVIH